MPVSGAGFFYQLCWITCMGDSQRQEKIALFGDYRQWYKNQMSFSVTVACHQDTHPQDHRDSHLCPIQDQSALWLPGKWRWSLLLRAWWLCTESTMNWNPSISKTEQLWKQSTRWVPFEPHIIRKGTKLLARPRITLQQKYRLSSIEFALPEQEGLQKLLAHALGVID